MKLVVEGTQAYRQYRGWGRYNELLLHGLKQRSSQNLEISVFYHDDQSHIPLSQSFENTPSFEIFPVAATLEEFTRIEEDFQNSYIDREFADCDLYHSVTEFPFYSKKVPLVCTIHEMTPVLFSDLFPPQFVSEFSHYVGYASKYADRLICPSANTKNDLVDYYNLDSDRIAVIPNCVKAIFTADMNIKNPQNYFLYVGGVNKPSKNFSCFLAAFQKCISIINYDFELIVVNSEHSQQSFSQQFAVDEREKKHIILKNKVTDKELVDLYQNASALIYPSYYEGFGLPIIEALACGCPVLCGSSLPVVNEHLTEGIIRTDITDVEILAESMCKIIEQKEMRKQQAMACCHVIQQKFSLDKFIDSHINVYASVL